MRKKFNSYYFIFSYPMVIAAWLICASYANGAIKSGKSLYHCVVIDTSRAGKDKTVDENTYIFDQTKDSAQASYVGKTATLEFDFNDIPMSISARHANSNRLLEFTDTKETPTRFDGYLEDADIEVHCRKKPGKSK